MNTERLTAVMERLTNNTVLGELLDPISDALERVRGCHAYTRVFEYGRLYRFGGTAPSARHGYVA